jgi:hypothetical protein
LSSPFAGDEFEDRIEAMLETPEALELKILRELEEAVRSNRPATPSLVALDRLRRLIASRVSPLK